MSKLILKKCSIFSKVLKFNIKYDSHNHLIVPNQEKDEIDHSTLMALLLYSNVDKEEPEFFSYLKKTLENLEKKHSQTNQNISKQEFIRIFTEPEISYQNLKIDEMASVSNFFWKKNILKTFKPL